MKPFGGHLKKRHDESENRVLVIPPACDAEFVAGMEDVLDIYASPYDFRCPVCAWTSNRSSC